MPSDIDNLTASMHPADVRPGDVLVPDGSAIWRLVVETAGRDDDGTWRYTGTMHARLPGYPPRAGTVTRVPAAIVVEAACDGPYRKPADVPRRTHLQERQAAHRWDNERGSDGDLYVYS